MLGDTHGAVCQQEYQPSEVWSQLNTSLMPCREIDLFRKVLDDILELGIIFSNR
jgi:hypothetical protein